MHGRRRERGLTIIESMIAMVVMLIGAIGLVGLYTTGLQMTGDARRITRATAIAQDLVNNIQLWPYSETSGPLVNSNASNDADIGDTALAFQQDGPPPADHGEADLATVPGGWLGIPGSALSGDYERYWNVAYVDDSNGDGVWDCVRIAVIVRWKQGLAWRRVVLLATKPNPLAG